MFTHFTGLSRLGNLLRRRAAITDISPRPRDDGSPLRPEAALPVHVAAEHGEVRLQDGLLTLWTENDERSLRLDEVSLLALHGNITITTPCLHALMRRGIPVLFHTRSGYYLGQLADVSANASQVRRAQYAAADDARARLRIARQLVRAKLLNARRLLRRRQAPRTELRRLNRLLRKARKARTEDKLRGLEGAAAALYWALWPQLIRARHAMFVFEGRTRRPPRDATNAALSYAYAVLTGACAAAALGVGLDPHIGFFHAERAGRPALALDMLEPFRPAVADAAILRAINTGDINEDCFSHQDDGAVLLSEAGRHAVLNALECRLSTRFAYPGTGRDMSWRSAITMHAQLLARALRQGETTFAQPVIGGS